MAIYPAKNILLVDDDETISESVKLLITEAGYRFFYARNCKEADKILQEQDIDLMLLDLYLPKMSGLDFLEKLKIVSANINVVMISGRDSATAAAECMKMGAKDYILKPIEPKSFFHKLESALK